MKKRLFEILLLFCCFNLFGNSTKEISESVTQLNSGEWFSWGSGDYNSLDSTYMVKNGSSIENPINYLKLSYRSSDKEFKRSFDIETSRRVSIKVKSATGAKVSLVDRMAGVLDVSGIEGKKDGRIDIDLDKGEYQIIVNSKDQEEIKIDISAYYDINSIKEKNFFLNSLPGEYLSLSLQDMEQRSFWIRIDETNKFYFEALGRNLNGASIWRDGLYKVDVKYNKETREVEKGRPLNFIEFNGSLPEGYYLIKLYGGLDNLWSVEKKENPLFVRGIQETIIGGGFKNIIISPFGNDNFFTTNANYFFGALKDKTDLTLKVGRSGNNSRYRSSYTSNIKYDSYDNICKLDINNVIDKGNFQVIGKPGTRLKVGAFVNSSAAALKLNDREDGKKRYWISGLNPDNPENSVDLIPLLQNRNRNIVKSGFINISSDSPLFRSYNLDGYISYFINIEESSSYVIQEIGDQTNASATFYIKNFRNFDESDELNMESGESVRLNKGYYILTVAPKKNGIHEFALFSKPITAITSKALLKEAEKIKDNNVNNTVSSFNWPEVELGHKTSGDNYTDYNLIFNSRKNKVLNIRELPMDLSENYLPFALGPNEAVNLEIKVDENSRLLVNGEDFEALDSKGKYPGLLTSGVHNITFKNNGKKSQIYSVGTTVSIPYTSYNAPNYTDLSQVIPKIKSNENIFENFERDETKSYLLEVDDAGLYRMETTGRLRTGITIRTPNITRLYSEYENGIGRNALINRFLRPGQYIVEVNTRGESRGRASTILRMNELTITKELSEGEVLREKVPEDYALKTPVNIESDGEFFFKTYLYNNSAEVRLEDEYGWPKYISRGSVTDFSSVLERGRYYLYSMPKNYESRRVTSFIEYSEAPKDELPLFGYLTDTWYENENRTPLKYNFEFNAVHSGEIYFSEELEVWISDKYGKVLEKSEDNRSLDFELGQGEYILNVRTPEPDNKREFTLEVITEEISQDNSRFVYGSGRYTISVGKESLVDIWSLGKSDVSAKLYDGNELLKSNEDAPNDWNFFISENLKFGRYSLDIVGSGYTEIRVKERSIKNNGNISLPYKSNIILKDEAQLFEVNIKGDIKPFIVEALSDKDVFISVLESNKVVVQGLNKVAVPLGEGKYQVQVLNRSSGSVAADINITTPNTYKVDFNKVNKINSTAAILENSEEINYYISGDDLLYSSGEGREFRPVGDISVNCESGLGYLLSNKGIIGNVTVKPLNLAVGKGETIKTYLDDSGFTFNNNKDYISVLSVSSPGSSIGISLNSNKVNWNHAWVSNTKSLIAISPVGDYKASVWNGDKTDVNTGVKLVSKFIDRDITFSDPVTLNIDKKETIKIKIPSGNVSVVSSRGVLISLWMGERLIKSYYGDSDDISFTVPKGEYELAVVNMINREGLINIKTGTEKESVNYINSRKSYESYLTNNTSLEFVVAALKEGEKLNVYGNLNKIRVYSDDGDYKELSNFENDITTLDKSGKLQIDAGSGLLKIWISNNENKELYFASNGTKLGKKKLNLDENKITKNIQDWILEVDKPVYVSLKTGSGGVLSLLDSDKLLDYTVGTYPDGRSLYYYLKPGSYTVIARSIEGSTQSGSLFFGKEEAKELKEGGLENELFINKGESHIYKFKVNQKGKVGAGVSSNKDYIAAKIYDSGFNLISSGIINFMNLDVGDYFMVVSSDIDTVRYRPVTYGIDGSIREIPEDVLKQYR